MVERVLFKHIKWCCWGALFLACLYLQGCILFVKGDFRSKPIVLVLPTESEMPDLPMDRLLSFRSQQDGPRIFVNTPKLEEVYTPPVPIDIRFEPRGEAQINIASLKVVYVKLFKVDITDRVTPYVQDNRIQIPEAEFPAGNHTFIISIADDSGRTSSQMMHLTVKDKS